MQTKICAYCGEEKSIEDFRRYYNCPSGTYTYCRSCEKIEARRKYLKRKCDNISPVQREELEKIEQLYKLRVDKGLAAPGCRRTPNAVSKLLDEQLSKLQEVAHDT